MFAKILAVFFLFRIRFNFNLPNTCNGNANESNKANPAVGAIVLFVYTDPVFIDFRLFRFL